MGADVGGVQLLRVFALPDTRIGREGNVGIVVQFMVDQDGPFHIEVDRDQFHPFAVVRQVMDTAKQIRALRSPA